MLPRVRYRKRSHSRVISTRHDQPSSAQPSAAAPASSRRESETSRTVRYTRSFRTPSSACHPAAAAAAAAPESPRPAADAAAGSPESRRPAAAVAIAAGSPESPRPAAPFARPSASCPFCVPLTYQIGAPRRRRGGGGGRRTHRVPILIDVCTRTTPIACTTACAWPTARITSSHEPSIVVPAECIVHLRPLARRRRWTAATSRATEGVEVPIWGGG